MALNAPIPPQANHPFGPSPLTAQHRSLTSTPLPGMGQAQQQPNPYTQATGAATGVITAPTGAATSQGIMQAAQKMAEETTLATAYPGSYPSLTTGRLGAPGNSSLSRRAEVKLAADAHDGMSDNEGVAHGTSSAFGLMGKLAHHGERQGIHSPKAAWPISPPGLQKSARFSKLAAAPMGPATAMPPAAPPPQPMSPLGVQGMIPPQPGQPPAGPPGAGAPQDPAAAAGAPPQDPNAAAAGGAPAPGGDPAAAGGQPPPTLNGEVPPMGMPPTPPLPANPRVNPPRQATPMDFKRRQDLDSLLAMDQQVEPENTAQSMQPDLLAMGSKSASAIERLALPGGDPKNTFEKSAMNDWYANGGGRRSGRGTVLGRYLQPRKRKRGSGGLMDAIGDAWEQYIEPEEEEFAKNAGIGLPDDDSPFMQGINAFVAQTFAKVKPWREKSAAQDNGKDQHVVKRSATGESEGLTYQYKPDHYAQGQEAWASVSGYFKGGENKKPNPFIGKHAAAHGVDGEGGYWAATGERCQHCFALHERGDDGNCNSCGKQHDAVKRASIDMRLFNRLKAEGCDDEEAETIATKQASGDMLAFKRFKAMGHSDEEADRLAGLPLDEQEKIGRLLTPFDVSYYGRHNRLPTDDEVNEHYGWNKQADFDPNPQQQQPKPMRGISALRRMRNKRQGVAEQPSISGATTQFKYASDPFAGKSTMPVVKPGFSLKQTPPQAPFNPGVGMLSSIKPESIQPLKLPKAPAGTTKTASVKQAGFWDGLLRAGAKGSGRVAGTVAKAAPRVAPQAVRGAGFTMANSGFGAGMRAGSSAAARAQPSRFATAAAAAPGHIASGANTAWQAAKAAPGHIMTGARAIGAPQSAMGFFSGGVTGSPGEGETIPDWVPLLGGSGFDYGRAMMGAAAFNPRLRQRAATGSTLNRLAAPVLNSIKGNIVGSFAGQSLDAAAKANGFDTGGFGDRWGSRIGTGLGFGKAVGRPLMQAVPQLQGVRRAMSPTLRSAHRSMSDLDEGAFRPIMNVATLPLRGTRDFLYGAAKPKGWVAGALEGLGAGQGKPIQGLRDIGGYVFGKAPKTIGGRVGNLVAGATALGYGGSLVKNTYEGLKQDMGEFGKEKMREGYEELAPGMAADMTHVADRYLDHAGLLDENGQAQLPRFNLGHQFGGMGRGAMQMADSLFARMGMDPNRMSPAQKIAILGGTGLLGAGAMTGSGGMAGLGALGMGGGMMMPSSNDVSPIMQLLNRMPRNEYMTQMQQTGQMPNANPYHGTPGPTL